MPKPVYKSKAAKLPQKLSSRDLLESLCAIRGQAHEIVGRINALELELCSRGLADRGPVTETGDDIPF